MVTIISTLSEVRKIDHLTANLPEAGVAAAAALNTKGNENFIRFCGAVERYSQTCDALEPANNLLIDSR
jgi:hypothetical protein